MRWLALGMLAIAVTASAEGTLSASWAVAGGEWAIFRWAGEGNFSVMVEMVGARGGAVIDLHLYDASGAHLGSSTAARTDTNAWAAAGAAGATGPRLTAWEFGGGGILRRTIAHPPPELMMVVVAVGRLEAASISVDAGVATRLAGGDRTWFVTGDEVPAGASVMVNAAGERATIQNAAKIDFRIDGRFVGRIGQNALQTLGEDETIWHHPAGSQECPCLVSDLIGPSPNAQGVHFVTRDAIKFEDGFPAPLMYGADVIIPAGLFKAGAAVPP